MQSYEIVRSTVSVQLCNVQSVIFIWYCLWMHGHHANYLLSGQIVAFFTICIRPETFLLSVSVSGQQNANRYRYKKNLNF